MATQMRFANPVFHKDANNTIRLGTKWKGAEKKGSGKIMLCNNDGVQIREVKVFKTEVKKFSELTKEDLAINHDPNMVYEEYREQVMKDYYGEEFSPDKEVTIVTFIVG